MGYKVKEVADIAGVSVRTLHHYDQIGLLKPAHINSAGYRDYSEDNLGRLQQILFFKELDFSLQEIKTIINSPWYDRQQALLVQKELLEKKIIRLQNMVVSIEKTISLQQGGSIMTHKETFKVFDMSEIEKTKAKYAQEVREKYDAAVVKECEEKTKNYSSKQWSEIQDKGNKILLQIAELMDRGPADEQVQKLIDSYRAYISDNFYHCTLEIFAGLGELYVVDPRFTKNMNKVADGFASFMKEAMKTYCEQQQ